MSVFRFQNQNRQTLTALNEIAVVGAEQSGKAIAAELVRLGQRQQLDEEAWKLNNVIVRAPGMAIARPHGETEPTVQIGRRIEVPYGMDDMVEASRHGGRLHQPALLDRSTDER
jgi:hypothetical protein